MNAIEMKELVCLAPYRSNSQLPIDLISLQVFATILQQKLTIKLPYLSTPSQKKSNHSPMRNPIMRQFLRANIARSHRELCSLVRSRDSDARFNRCRALAPWGNRPICDQLSPGRQTPQLDCL